MAEEAPPPEPALPLSDDDFASRKEIFDEIFPAASAEEFKAKSLAERKENAMEGQAGLTYAELELVTLHWLLNKVKSECGPLFVGQGTFLDLGSGAGKACIAAGLLHPFEKVVGIETLQSLSDAAAAAQAKYKEVALPQSGQKPEIDFIKGDFVADFEAKLEPIAAQVVMAVAVATMFGPEQLQAMGNLAKKMPDNSIFATLTHRLPSEMVLDETQHPARRYAQAVKKALAVPGTDPSMVEIVEEPIQHAPDSWTLLVSEALQLPWGQATCFIYKKIPLAKEAPAEQVAEVAAE